MNTPISLEIEKLLIEKDIDMPVKTTIADVVMWLYEKHGIWTVVNVNIMGSWYFEHFDLKEKRNAQFKPTDTHYDSPTEAYEAAIIYTLKNLI